MRPPWTRPVCGSGFSHCEITNTPNSAKRSSSTATVACSPRRVPTQTGRAADRDRGGRLRLRHRLSLSGSAPEPDHDDGEGDDGDDDSKGDVDENDGMPELEERELDSDSDSESDSDSDSDFLEMSDSPFSDDEITSMRTTAGTAPTPPSRASACATSRRRRASTSTSSSCTTRWTAICSLAAPASSRHRDLLPDEPDISFSSSDSEEDSDGDEAPPDEPPHITAEAALRLLRSSSSGPVDRAAASFFTTARKAVFTAMKMTAWRASATPFARPTSPMCIVATPPTRALALRAGLSSSLSSNTSRPGTFQLPRPTPKLSHNFKKEWQEAIHKEIKNLTDHETWTWVDLPPGRKPIDSHGFKVKPNDKGQIDKFKARLARVASGKSMATTTSAPCPSHHVVSRVCIADAAHHGYLFSFFDNSGAYLKSKLMEEIYMTPPAGVEAPEGKVALLLKALYGLKQAGRSWYGELTDILVEQLHFDRAVSTPASSSQSVSTTASSSVSTSTLMTAPPPTRRRSSIAPSWPNYASFARAPAATALCSPS